MIEGSLEVRLPTMDRWESRGGKSQRREEKTREDKRREEKRRQKKRREEKRREEERRSKKRKSQKKESEERVRRKSQKKEDPGAQKGRKVAKHCVFPLICGPGGSKSRLAKAVGAEQSGQMRDDKLHSVVVKTTFRSQNVQNTSASDHFRKLRCRKSARRCGAKHISKSKCTKHTMLRPLLEVEMSKKCTPFWREAHFEVKMYKAHHVQSTFGRSDVVSRGRRKGLCTLFKVSKTWKFSRISKNAGKRGTFEEDLERCIFRGRRSTRDIFIRDVRRSGRWFPENGCVLEHQIFSFGKMILCDRCTLCMT